MVGSGILMAALQKFVRSTGKVLDNLPKGNQLWHYYLRQDDFVEPYFRKAWKPLV
jgi:hypothetical protein